MRLDDRATVAIYHMIHHDPDSARFPLMGATLDELQRIRQAATDVANMANDVLRQVLDDEAAITGYGHVISSDGTFRDATYGEYLTAHGVTLQPADAEVACG